ncbi:hypothetical protein OH77DRAFT_567480 [Trametes cingulata]|nr:hypothetical protein OH77DRAFT_567480 [Trametes cingulata]
MQPEWRRSSTLGARDGLPSRRLRLSVPLSLETSSPFAITIPGLSVLIEDASLAVDLRVPGCATSTRMGVRR